MRHNIVGCEATDTHRLIAFGHVHGSMAWGRRRTYRPRLVLAFLAGVGAALALGVLLARG